MDEEIDRLLVAVRADTRGFARDVASMRAEIDGPFSGSIGQAGRILENSLLGAIGKGKAGFADFRSFALSVLGEIASAAIRGGLTSLVGPGQGKLVGSLTSLVGGLLGLPGRATGGPVSPGQAYRVGENGPELFMPTSSGRIEANGSIHSSAANINMTINISDNGQGSAPDGLRRSSRHVARAVRQALQSGES